MNTKEKPKILVIDDDPICRKALSLLLFNNYGCCIDAANSAIETLNIINEMAFEWDYNGFDLIFLDIHLPDFNGDVITNIIRKTQIHAAKTPIIAVTGKTSNTQKQRFLSMGMTDILIKPISLRKIDRIIKKYLAF